jgi:hypothetical protein
MPDRKMCPIFRAMNPQVLRHQKECLQEGCAFYLEGDAEIPGECSMKTAARELRYIRKNMD